MAFAYKIAALVAAGGSAYSTVGVAQCKDKDEKKEAVDKTGLPGFDPDALERGAKAIREIDRSANAKAVYEMLREQERTKQQAEKVKEAEAAAQAAAYAAQREKIRQEEEHRRERDRAKYQAELMGQQGEMDRRKTQEEHELSRKRNAEYLESQKNITIQIEENKLKYEQQIQAERRATANHEAELQKQVAVERALAEGRARAMEHRENRDIFMEEIGKSASEWGKQYMLLLSESFQHLGTGARLLLTSEYGVNAVYGAAALFLAYYGIRGGLNLGFGCATMTPVTPAAVADPSTCASCRADAEPGLHVTISSKLHAQFYMPALADGQHVNQGLPCRQLERFITTPPLVRETSRYHLMQRIRNTLGMGSPSGVSFDKAILAAEKSFSDIVLPANVKHEVRSLAASAANTRLHGAPFRHFLFYGPPGTGKTLVAKRLAHTSGLDYAIMSGGDVAPLGANAVKQMHEMFDWATRSPKGMVLFVDEADAFLSHRDGNKSEAMRSAINAMLYRTGDQSRDFMVIIATNRPEDLDPAVRDRIDEQIEFELPDRSAREELLSIYFAKYVDNAAADVTAGLSVFQRVGRAFSWVVRGTKASADSIKLADFDRVALIQHAAAATEGFSGRELAKLMASVQAAAYATRDATLTPEIFKTVVKNKGQTAPCEACAGYQAHIRLVVCVSITRSSSCVSNSRAMSSAPARVSLI